jgi:phosphatidylserine/phosphatidylglycerophosphate/cardiolipin synthase-like enzyme
MTRPINLAIAAGLLALGAVLGALLVFATLVPAARSPAMVTTLPPITMAFTQHGDHPDVLLANGVDQASARVDAALYGLNRKLDVDALINAQGRCKCVRLITDATQAGGASQKAALIRIQQAGIPVKADRHQGLMHMKAVAIDGNVLYEGSFNATDPASMVNDEVLFRIASSELARAFGDEFDTMWNDARRYRDWTPSLVPTPKAAE